MNKVYKIKNYVDKDKVLSIKNAVIFKEIIGKCFFGFYFSGYLSGKGFII